MLTLRDLKTRLATNCSTKVRQKFNNLVKLNAGKNVVLTLSQFHNFLSGGTTTLDIDSDFEFDNDDFLSTASDDPYDDNSFVLTLDEEPAGSAPPGFGTTKNNLKSSFVRYFNMAANMEPHKLYRVFVDEVAPQSDIVEVGYKAGKVFHWSCGKVAYNHLLQNNLGTRKTGKRPPGYMSSSVTSTALETFKMREDPVPPGAKWDPLNPISCTTDTQVRYSAFLLYVMQNFAVYGGKTKNQFRSFVEQNCHNEHNIRDDRGRMDLWSMDVDSGKVFNDPDFKNAYMVVTPTGIVKVTHTKTRHI